MKKYLNVSLAYAIAAMIGGVFYREFTKALGFTGVTVLGKVHTHLFLLGMLVFLIIGLFADHHDPASQKPFRAFLIIYNIGVPLTVVMMAVRGVAEVLSETRGVLLSHGLDAAISGIAGIAHILTGVGILLLLLSLRGMAKPKDNA